MFTIQYLPIIKDYFSQPIHQMSIKDKLLDLYYYPINYPLWFLRALIPIFIITPLIYIFVKYLNYVFLILIFLILFFGKDLSFYDLKIISIVPLFYFSLGSFLALKKIKLNFNAKWSIAALLLIAWITLNIISLYDVKFNFTIDSLSIVLDVSKNLIGCIGVWYLYDLLNRKKQWKNYDFYNSSFFIFVFHGIPTLILVKISDALFNNPYYLSLVSDKDF